MEKKTVLKGVAAAALLVAVSACERTRDGTASNPPSTATQRAFDAATGAPRTPADGRPGNPPATAAERAFDRATGSNTTGAYPGQRR